MARISALVWWVAEIRGRMDWTKARAGVLVDRPSAWLAQPEARWLLQGFEYEGVAGTGLDWDLDDRLAWLRRDEDSSPGAYHQLAHALRAHGRDADARQVLIAANERLAAPERDRVRSGWPARFLGRPTLANPKTYAAPLPKPPRRTVGERIRNFWRRWLLGTLTGHGYQPWRILIVAAVLIVALWTWVGLGPNHSEAMVPSDPPPAGASCGEDHPCLRPLVFAADVVIPVVDFGQQDAWRANRRASWGSWYQGWIWASIALGWITTTIGIGAVTGLAKRV